MTVPMSRDVSNFPEQVQLFKLLSFMYVDSHRDYLTVESKDVVVAKHFLMLHFTPYSFKINYFQ